jgi:hypothetical protein
LRSRGIIPSKWHSQFSNSEIIRPACNSHIYPLQSQLWSLINWPKTDSCFLNVRKLTLSDSEFLDASVVW